MFSGQALHHFLFFLLYGLLNAVGFFLTGRFLHIMLVWNVLLAAIPVYLAHQSLRWQAKHKVLSVLFGLGWLLFWPNAYYMVTDFIHIAFRPFYQDQPYLGVVYSTNLQPWSMLLCIGIGMVYASLCGAVSQLSMARRVRARFGQAAAVGFVVLCSGLCGVALYIGRFLRINSWDVLQPWNILRAFLNTDLPFRFSAGIVTLFAGYALAITAVVGLFLYANPAHALSEEGAPHESKR